jgi:hypothetical protein
MRLPKDECYILELLGPYIYQVTGYSENFRGIIRSLQLIVGIPSSYKFLSVYRLW